MKTSRIFLTTSIVIGVVSITPMGGDFCYGILRPLSAILFILAFITGVVEAAEADHERHAGAEPAKITKSEPVADEVHCGDYASAH